MKFFLENQDSQTKFQRLKLYFDFLLSLHFLEKISSNFKEKYSYEYKTTATKSYKQYYDHSIDEIDESFINRITMKSSNVKWIDYIKDLEILVVRFKGGSGYYLYYDVPLNVYLKFRNTDSPGKFVHQYLYGYKYESLNAYAEWLNVYKNLSDITDK